MSRNGPRNGFILTAMFKGVMAMPRRMLLAVALMLCAHVALAARVVIDVRTPEEFAGGHLPGALNIDHGLIAAKIASTGVKKDDEIILYCRSGRRADIALKALKDMGYRNVSNYGGLDEARLRLTKRSP